jgi:hypothetical protein
MTRLARPPWVRPHRTVLVGPRQAGRILGGLEARHRRPVSFAGT